MRFSKLQWLLIFAVTVHSILGVEGKKTKNQLEEGSDEDSLSERKYVMATRENKKFRSPELQYEERSRQKDFTTPKKIRNNVLGKDGDSEIRNGKKIRSNRLDSKILPEEMYEDFTVLKYKEKKYKDKKRRNLVEENNEISHEMEEEEPREKKQPSKLKYQQKEYQNKQRKNKLRETSDESQEKEEFEEEPVRQKKKKYGKENQLSEDNASNEKHSVKEVQTKEFCRRIDSTENGCLEDFEDSDTSEEEQEMSEIKKIKYSKKFAHEKSSKKQKNKEEENILKLHRKAESDVKTAKKLKKMRRIQDEEEESSEEIAPRRRLAVYEDEDDV